MWRWRRMKDITNKALSVLRLLRQSGPEADVSKRWLLHTAGTLNRRFAAENKLQVAPYGDYQKVIVQGQTFLWPANADLGMFTQLLSELFTPDHPHQYNFGNTRLTPEDIVLDIGACEGSFSAHVKKRVRRVIAVEPSRVMCELIRQLFALRAEECPVIINCLLGSEPSTAHFEDNVQNPGQAGSAPSPAGLPTPFRCAPWTIWSRNLRRSLPLSNVTPKAQSIRFSAAARTICAPFGPGLPSPPTITIVTTPRCITC